MACFHGIIVCVLGSKQGPPTTPLHTGIVTLAVVVPFVVVAKFILGITVAFIVAVVASGGIIVLLPTYDTLVYVSLIRLKLVNLSSPVKNRLP